MYQNAPPVATGSSSHSTWKVIKIGCSIMLVFFGLSVFGFYWLCNTLMEKSEEYENSLTELTGVFKSDIPVVSPLSGEIAVAVSLHVKRTFSEDRISNSSGYKDDIYDVLIYNENARFISNGKEYRLFGTRPFKFSGGVIMSDSIEFRCREDKTTSVIPATLSGLDSKTDKWIGEYEKSDCGFGVSGNHTRVIEYCYSVSDTVKIKAFVSNDSIFLYQ